MVLATATHFFKSLFSKPSFLPASQKQSVPFTTYLNGVATYPAFNYAEVADGAYSSNELVYAAIKKVAETAPESPLMVWDREGHPIDKHPLRSLIAKPNPYRTEFELWEETIHYLYLTGNAFWLKERSRAGKVVQLWSLRPDRIRIIPDSQNYLRGYQYVIGTETIPLMPEEVVHFKFFSPKDEYWGLSPIKAAYRQIATDNEATDYSKTLLQNNALPSIVVTTQERIDQDLAERLKSQWKKSFGGRSRGDPAFLQEGMSVQTLSMDMQQLAFAELRGISETRICAVLGVPPILIGAKAGLDRSTFSNMGEARKYFWQTTIASLHRRLSDRLYLDDDLNPGVGYCLGFDTSEVTAFAEDRNAEWDRNNAAVAAGYITVNEARARVNLSPVPNGDVFLRPFGLSPVSITEPQGEEPTPSEDPSNVTDQTQDPEQFQEAQQGEDAQATDQSQKRMQVKSVEDELRLLQIAIGRQKIADKYFTAIEEWAKKEFAIQGKETIKVFNNTIQKGRKDATLNINFMGNLMQMAEQWVKRGRNGIYPVLTGLITESAESTRLEFGLDFNMDNSKVKEFIDTYTYKFAKAISDTSLDDIRGVMQRAQDETLTVSEIKGALQEKFTDWTSTRATMVARSETIRSANRGAKAAYQAAGVKNLQWVTAGDGCPYCRTMDKKIIPIDSNFVDLGGALHPEVDADSVGGRPLVANYEAVETPPLHPNCRCAIKARID
jgi:HK97 family phage portal protein